jgi:DNA polymerase-1
VSFDFGANVEASRRRPCDYETVDTTQALGRLVTRARKLAQQGGVMAVDTETVIDPDSPSKVDPLRSRVVGISMALERGRGVLPAARPPRAPAGAAGARPAADAEQAAADANVEPEDGGADGEAKPKKKAKVAKPKAPSESAIANTGIAGRMLAERSYPVRNLPPLDAPEMRELVALLADDAVPKVLQNAKYDVLALRRAGVRLGGVAFDTMLASYVLDPGRRSHGLDVLALELLDHRMTSYEELCGRGRQQLPFDVVPIEAATEYSAEDADMTLRLRERFAPQLEDAGLAAAPRRRGAARRGARRHGGDGDRHRHGALPVAQGALPGGARARGEGDLRRGGEEFNINSNTQLRTSSSRSSGCRRRSAPPRGPSTDASVLQELADEGHAIPQLSWSTARSSSSRGRTSTRCRSSSTRRRGASTRRSTRPSRRRGASRRRPEPAEHPHPPRARARHPRGFVPRKGWKLLSADYSQIELRLLAHLSQDPAFVAAFRAAATSTARRRRSSSACRSTEVTRRCAGAPRRSTSRRSTAGRARAVAPAQDHQRRGAQFIETYFERFRGVKDYLDGQVEFAREHGYVETIFKRRRYVPELKERNFNIRAFGERVAQNAPDPGLGRRT